MIGVKQKGELVLINTEMITYVSTEIDYRYPDAEYRINIQFAGGTHLVVSFSTESEREDFIDEIVGIGRAIKYE